METFYPSGPQTVPPTLTQPTSLYKKRTWLAIMSLSCFIVTYIALASWFAWTAYRTFNDMYGGGPNVVLDFFVGSCAGFLALFMFKALFFIKRGGTPNSVEITAAEQPRLFEFIYQLADEAGTQRPARVYLSAEVNAAVFYDLSILNLLLPSRKNLDIGLALVNVLTLSEIKAVLAHEFGHFAQRSMAIGSWVYIAQQIAEQVIVKRDALDKILRFISNIDLRIAWIGWLLSLIVWSIRSLMDTLLSFVVLAQRALSREMEFQADLVAVSLTGSDELVHALYKLQSADEAWGRVMSFTHGEVQQGRIPHDLFQVQTIIIDKLAHILNDANYGKVPSSTAKDPAEHRVFKTSFSLPPHMWASHPVSADREHNTKKVYIPAPHDARSAWVLFENADQVKEKVTAQILKEAKAERASPDQTLDMLNADFARVQFNPRYRGAYIGRQLTRYAAKPDELYGSVVSKGDIQQALAKLYAPQLVDDLATLRSLEEERTMLEALRDKIYQATSGRIIHRGNQISRSKLPATIKAVATQETQVRECILAHDRTCRSIHVTAANQLGGDWGDYLIGLINTLHYAEHTLANLQDAHGLLINVLEVVTADGRISKSELKKLLAVANELHTLLASIYRQQQEIRLDPLLSQRLGIDNWQGLFEEFTLGAATKENIDQWLQVIDGWVRNATQPLSLLCDTAIEQLLITEELVEQHIEKQTVIESAPIPSTVPTNYSTLLPGQERKRLRLTLWDRFVTASGMLPALARSVVALTIVGSVLWLGSITGTFSTLSIYNGLGRPVKVDIGSEQIVVQPFAARQLDLELTEDTKIEAHTMEGDEIELFTPQLTGRTQHYVYNIAAASPLLEWVQVYGSAKEQPPRLIGAQRWSYSHAEIFFSDPPRTVKTSDDGATRVVLSGFGDDTPDDALALLSSEAERQHMVLTHAKWDKTKYTHTQRWRDLAATMGKHK